MPQITGLAFPHFDDDLRNLRLAASGVKNGHEYGPALGAYIKALRKLTGQMLAETDRLMRASKARRNSRDIDGLRNVRKRHDDAVHAGKENDRRRTSSLPA